MKIIVLGAGAWGTALAVSAASHAQARHEVSLWARDAGQAAAMQAQRENTRYLPTVKLPPGLTVSSTPLVLLADLASRADLVIVATPMSGLRAMLSQLSNCPVPVAWLCKGFEAVTAGPYGLLPHEVQEQVAPGLASIGQMQLHAGTSAGLYVAVLLLEAVHGAVDVQLRIAVGGQCGQQQSMQVGPVDGGVRKTVARPDFRPQCQHAQLGPRAGTAHLQTVREGGHGGQFAFQTPVVQHAHHSGAQLNACADLAELSCPLEQRDAGTGPRTG